MLGLVYLSIVSLKGGDDGATEVCYLSQDLQTARLAVGFAGVLQAIELLFDGSQFAFTGNDEFRNSGLNDLCKFSAKE